MLAKNFTSPYIRRSEAASGGDRLRARRSARKPGAKALAFFFTSAQIPGLSSNWRSMAADRPDPSQAPPSSVEAGKLMGLGLQFAASILLFLFVGHWLDGKLGSSPWLLLLGAFVGGGAGFYSLYRQLVTVPAERRREREAGGK
jgi:ATP synthase protein I